MHIPWLLFASIFFTVFNVRFFFYWTTPLLIFIITFSLKSMHYCILLQKTKNYFLAISYTRSFLKTTCTFFLSLVLPHTASLTLYINTHSMHHVFIITCIRFLLDFGSFLQFPLSSYNYHIYTRIIINLFFMLFWQTFFSLTLYI